MITISLEPVPHGSHRLCFLSPCLSPLWVIQRCASCHLCQACGSLRKNRNTGQLGCRMAADELYKLKPIEIDCSKRINLPRISGCFFFFFFSGFSSGSTAVLWKRFLGGNLAIILDRTICEWLDLRGYINVFKPILTGCQMHMFIYTHIT